MASYPDGIKSWTNVADNTDHVMAAHINEAYAEIIALEENAAKQSQLSNPNLLINPFFQINQRGQTVYTPTGYIIDGWYLTQGSVGSVSPTITLVDGGITVQVTERAAYVRQFIETDLTGVHVTASVLAGDVLYSVHCMSPSKTDGYQEIGNTPFGSLRFGYVADRACYNVVLYCNTVATTTFKAVKLERGGVSTLANDVPPKIATDLAECQRYFRVWKTEAARTAALNEVGLMRLAAPTLGTINIGGVTYYTASAEL